MNLLKSLLLGLAVTGTVGLAVGQAPANISVVSGNGQLVCGLCSSTGGWNQFEPLKVLVTDSLGNPVANATVNWSILQGNPATTALSSPQTTTGTDGTTSNTFTAIFIQSRVAYTVIASLANSSSVTFTVTSGAPESSTQYAYSQVTDGRGTISGLAGGTGTPSVAVKVQDFSGQVIANVSVRLTPAPGYTPGASVACATGAGADPGSVLTDQNGVAVCTPILGPVPGTGSYHIVVGGVANPQANAGGALGYNDFGGETIQVSPGTPSSLKIISGSPQSANAGQALASALVGEVDSSSGNPVSGATVNWSVSPAGAASLANSTTTADANGRVTNNVTLSSTATGNVQVIASVGSAAITFSISVNVAVTGLTIASGDGQSATVGTAFAQPLVVQLNGAGGQIPANVPVQFAITGPGTLSTSSVNTDSNGRASVTVTAGSSAGAVVVTATSGTYSRSFALTVVPPGPAITQSSFLNGAGFFGTDSIHAALTPCGIGTVIAPGIAPSIQGVVTGPMVGPLPYQLAQVTISFNGSQAPLFNVANANGQQQATFQVPCDLIPSNSVPVSVIVGAESATVNVVVRSAGPGIFQYTDSAGLQQAVIVRPDGSYVSSTNRARAGETLRLYVTGIGQVKPAVATNAIPVSGTDSVAQGNVVVGVNNLPGTGISARRAPGMIGVDEIAFQLPSGVSTGNAVLYVAVYPADNSGIQVSNTTWIPIQ